MQDFDLKSMLGGLDTEKTVYKSTKEEYTHKELMVLVRNKLAAVLESSTIEPAALDSAISAYITMRNPGPY